ncbi:flavodoxin family protein [Desulfotignum phosphitoxidans]|uniref:Putative iron-sulfur flavoprotein n=1 Tax=Desulfotignum phosphitoxidans DSM 13687 TaxID=1286635 RepID=S0G7C5_9BACT|nr:flavodoxin family protein [Desulfotignum phosphitoxidans]EMS81052.1 putative iron-sulfur flavoprotein [Desulfotignum phosphitoxidans DSM 13687]
MKILILNGSPRKNGTVATLLKAVAEPITNKHETEWIDVCKLDMKFCTACMACRDKGTCVLPEDDAHRVGQKIQQADALVIGTPTHWGNMCAPLKLLFDRNVPVFMGESPKGMPEPRQKGKRAVIVTACTTPWPFNFIFPESRGAIRAVKEVLHYGGYKLVGTITKPGTKKTNEISSSLMAKAERLGKKLIP